MRHSEQTPEQRERADSMQRQVSAALHSAMADSERSGWTQDFKFGVSDIGHCREYLRRLISREEFSDEQDDYSAAFMGTAVSHKCSDRSPAVISARCISRPRSWSDNQLSAVQGYARHTITRRVAARFA